MLVGLTGMGAFLTVVLACLLTYLYSEAIPRVTPGFVPYTSASSGRHFSGSYLSRMAVCDSERPEVVDDRSSLVLVGCRISAIFSDVWFGLNRLPYQWNWRETVTEVPHPEPSVLVVLVHGLRGHPSCFRSYIAAILAVRPDARIVIPYVHKRGLCTLDEASQPIINLVKDHLSDVGPQVPVWLIGTSNGGRIVANVESSLRDLNSIIHTVTIGAPLGGSRAMWLVDAISPQLAEFYLPNGLAEELRPESNRSAHLLAAIRRPVRNPLAKRAYTCTVTLDEHNIWPPNYALPLLNVPVQHAYTDAVGHSAVTAACRDYVIARLTDTDVY